MNLAKQIEEIFTVCLEKLELAWWVEIITCQPACTYYFGPFITAKDAELSQNGYIEDLEQEKAQGIAVKIKQCQPMDLTICQD
ncbi:DUF1816 domain-containing protein [Microcoleus sp. FACHB-68]|uniref:DUF1816 domain-containing protein n=1 Tax=Microcoleus sp. FACHB-68 TaxID=2692826 RepID=UPI00168890ED|nr:DUF1816 domain-containing protein [Microcoleus sp. FACHB-68]MBD1939621.1 DUF1816 domain-containing protein [Microcoleus sp. FACHB-68]